MDWILGGGAHSCNGVGIVHDLVRTQTGWGAPIELFPYFVIAFVASESQSLLRAFARAFATAEKLSLETGDSLLAQDRSFVDVVRERGMPEVTGDDGYRALDLALRIQESLPPFEELMG